MSSSLSLSREAVREYDRKAIERGIPGSVLMENAARGAFELLIGLGATGPVAIMCGKGNNGGDGFVMARLLHERKIAVHVELLADPGELTGDAAWAFEPLGELGINVRRADDNALAERLRGCQWIVDGLLGTGMRGQVRAPYDTVIEAINGAGGQVLAIDLPSGLDCDRGIPLGPTVRADHTATFVARKLGFDNPESEQYTGQVHVIDIGAGPLLP